MAQRVDLVIAGGGAAGLTAGLYAARARLDTVLLERLAPGGQIINAERVENYPGFPEGVSGYDLSSLFASHALNEGLRIATGEVNAITPVGDFYRLATREGDEYIAKAVVIAGGSTLARLGIPGEAEFEGQGVSYCATCDGEFFRDQTVAVVGGGDSALDEALVLSRIAARVIVIHRRDELRATRVLQERAFANRKIEFRWQTVVEAITGDSLVTGVRVRHLPTGEVSVIPASGVFIYVGLQPNTSYLHTLLPLDAAGHIPTDIWMATPLPGIFAAGDIRQHSARQVVSAAGDGATAAIAAERYIHSRDWPEEP